MIGPRSQRVTAVIFLIVLLTLSLWAQSAVTLPRHAVLGASIAETDGGVLITSVRPGSSADRGGLRVDDVIHSLGGHAIDNLAEFVSLIKATPTGQPIAFDLKRDNKTLTVQVVLDSAPNENDPLVTTLYEAVSVDGTLRRTLVTIPSGIRGSRPAVLILGGIGCFSIDNALDPEDSYMRLAHDLGRQGFVAMRLEKSGIGDSQGPPCTTVDLVTEMQSYEVALQALKVDPHVNKDRIYLFGHSIGTLIAPRIANQQKLAGVIIAEGVGRNWIEYELWNLRRQLKLGGEGPTQIDAKLAEKETCMHRLLVAKEPEAEIERTQPECKVHNAYPAPASYMQQVAALNIAEPWTHFSLPLLAIYGTADFVAVEEDHRRIVDIVNGNHAGTAELRLVSGMDHHLDVAGTQQRAYDLRVKEHTSGPYDKGLSTAVLDWLCLRQNCVTPSSTLDARPIATGQGKVAASAGHAAMCRNPASASRAQSAGMSAGPRTGSRSSGRCWNRGSARNSTSSYMLRTTLRRTYTSVNRPQQPAVAG
jgi:uncharacterized protein